MLVISAAPSDISRQNNEQHSKFFECHKSNKKQGDIQKQD